MRIYVQNRSTVLTDTQVQATMPAFTTYARSVARSWGLAMPTMTTAAPPNAEQWTITLLDDSDQAGALGYHDFTPGGKPVAKVFARTDQLVGASWTVTLTHELAEMLVDPWISAMQTAGNRLYAVEVGDPVEADRYALTVGGVACSDYVLPAWFIPGQPGPYDIGKHCARPLEVLPGGYAQYLEVPAAVNGSDGAMVVVEAYRTGTGQLVHNIHHPDDCAGRPCVIHAPSDHPMRSFPTHFRFDRYLMERICPHGVGHPDPDDVAFHLAGGRDEEGIGVHGCDGCCGDRGPA